MNAACSHFFLLLNFNILSKKKRKKILLPLFQLGYQMYPNVSPPPEPAPPDHHLLTPSSILRQLKENAAVSQSQSSLEEINCNKKSNFIRSSI